MLRLVTSSLNRRLVRTFADKKSIALRSNYPFPLAEKPNQIYPDKPNLSQIEDNAYVEYKQYPYLPHQDPNSKAYIASELDEYHDKTEAAAFNSVIDQFKHDIRLQKEIWNAIDKLDRTYKKGIPGVHTNLPQGVQKPKLQDLGFDRTDLLNGQNHTFSNEDAFISNTPYELAWIPSNIKEWREQIKNRPVNKHYNHGKGYKYDVPVKPEEKYEYLADRLGHPEFIGTPLERLYKLENDIYHPEYVDQPFVRTPRLKPDASLNFEEGEVLYENTRLLEWLKFWQLTAFTGAAYGVLFVPYQLVYKTHLSLPIAEESTWTPYHYVSPFNMDTWKISVPAVAGVLAYGVYLVLNFTNVLTSQYPVKISYNKDRELVFIKRIDLHGSLEEEVYETAHLEILPPNIVSGLKDLSAQDPDGITTITCMNTLREMLVYNDKRYWNPKLRKDFFRNHLNMWDKSYYGFNRPESEIIEKQWREELNNTLNQKELPHK